MARSRDFDDEDWDDQPRPKSKRKKKSRPSTGLLIALGAGLGVIILMCGGGVGFLIFGGARGSLPLGGLLPHPALAKPATVEMYAQVTTGETQSSVERKLRAGCPLSAADLEKIMVPRQGPNAGFGEPKDISLKDLGYRPAGNAAITQWFQWGSGLARIFLGFGPNDKGEPVVLVKYYLMELPGGGYESMSERAGMTIMFGGQPEVKQPGAGKRPRK